MIVLAFGYPLGTALTVSASLAQIGEFSFILASLGLALGLLPPQGRDLVLAGALLSIALNPLVFAGVPAILRMLRSRESLVRLLERGGGPRLALPTDEAAPMQDHAVVVGHGRVGGAITPLLEHERLPFVVIERDRLSYEGLRDRGVPCVYGDASARGVLQAACIAHARILVIASPDGFQARRILELARAQNPHIQTFVRTHSEEELEYLESQRVGFALMGERELARGLGEQVLRGFGVPPARAHLLARGDSAADLAETAERL